MTTQFLPSGANVSIGSQRRDWVVSDSPRNGLLRRGSATDMSPTKLLFNDAFPASTRNRASRVFPPAPIVIERLLPLMEEREDTGSARSSVSFTALSEEKLQAAVQLAKRDLRRRRRESLTKSPSRPHQEAPPHETSDIEMLQELTTAGNKTKLKTSSPKAIRSKLSANTPQKRPVRPMPRVGRSPPTRDPGPRPPPAGKQAPLSQEINKLQNELEVYIQKVEELALRGGETEELLEPEEQDKLEMRRQKQAGRSAQVIYVLQQQVKEIQEDVEKLRSQKMWDTKKSVAVNRLAAAHRGTLRALQLVIQQLSDLSQGKLPPHYRELGQLIRQLSLCSAKVGGEPGSAVPQAALDILHKLETLDSALSKQEQREKMQVRACPPRRKSPQRSSSPQHSSSPPKGPSTSTVRGPRRAANPKRGVRGRRADWQKPRATSQQITGRKEAFRSDLEGGGAYREPQRRPQINPAYRRPQIDPAHRQPLIIPAHRKADGIMKRNPAGEVRFQQPTVSSQLRVNQPPQKENSVPWIPTSPHSPPPRSPHRRRAEPRCLFSSGRPSLSPQRPGLEPALSPERKRQAESEALRNAWLDRVTMQRLKELEMLSREETQRLQTLRSEVVSPTRWADQAEQEARERIRPLLEEAQRMGESRTRMGPELRARLSEQAAERALESAEQLSAALLDDLLEDAARAALEAEDEPQLEAEARRRLQAPTLESMLLRMDEIQRDQDEVRRRFASITYSDPLYWDRAATTTTGPGGLAPGPRPASPQPIRLTRPVTRPSCAADIVLQDPVETGHSEEEEEEEEASRADERPRRSTAFPGTEGSEGTAISVPGDTLRNIRRYRGDYDTFLDAVSHEAGGGFNTWALTDSLAEELLMEALADVAAEFQDVVEEYAEAVFTSEFLSPPSASGTRVGTHRYQQYTSTST